jgi:peptidoglycan hydrolase CwlO-like protein
MYDKIYDNYHILYSTEKSMGNSSGDYNSLDKELHDTKHQVDFLLNQANDLMGSVQNKDNDNANKKTPRKSSSFIQNIVYDKLSETKREQGMLLLGRIISAQQTYIELLERKVRK